MSTKKNRWSSPVFIGGLVIMAGLLVLRTPIQRHVMLSTALRHSTVTPELVEEIASQSSDAISVYKKFWDTGKIPHRLAAMRAFNRGQSVIEFPEIPTWLHNAAMDRDLHVRELALGILASANDPALERIVHAWLMEPDPELNILALRQARTSSLTNLAHTVAPLLEHADLQVRIAAASNLRVWTGQDFGVRLMKLNGKYDEATTTYTGDDLVRVNQVKDGLKQWRDWWAANGDSTFEPAEIGASPGTSEFLVAPDFTLHSLDHKDVSLASLRGKPVLLNFWATWCSACWSEIPDLVELNDRLGDRVHIIGISLDGLPDQHEIDHGHSHSEGHDHSHGAGHEDLEELVAGFVKKHKMDYPILLDPEGVTSLLYVGNELPMNVMIDAEGKLHRRFMGSRSLAGFEAMLGSILPE
jgi:thiol-disulfide isomerase/thioredoxin